MATLSHNRYEREYKNLPQRIRTSRELSGRNKILIIRFENTCVSEGLSAGRILKYLTWLCSLAKWLRKDFDKVTKNDMVKLLGRIERMNYSEWTKHDLKVTLKKFYKWLRGGEDYPPEVRWFKTPIRNNKRILPEELLSEDEVKKLIAACRTSQGQGIGFYIVRERVPSR